MNIENENCISETEENTLRRPFDAINARLRNGETENDEDKAFCEFYPLIRKLANRYRRGSRDLADELEGYGIEAFICYYRDKGGAKLYAEDPSGKFAENVRQYIRDAIRNAKRKLFGRAATAEIPDEERTEKTIQVCYCGSLEPYDEEDTEQSADGFPQTALIDRRTEQEIEARETIRGIAAALTNREKTVFQLLLEGHSRAEIAEILGITVQAVAKTTGKIRAKAERYAKEA